jgi:hypothetical protein
MGAAFGGAEAHAMAKRRTKADDDLVIVPAT